MLVLINPVLNTNPSSLEVLISNLEEGETKLAILSYLMIDVFKKSDKSKNHLVDAIKRSDIDQNIRDLFRCMRRSFLKN